jgi:hypothetical protein
MTNHCVTVYASGLQQDSITINDCDTLVWSRDSQVDHFIVHFEVSPFEANFGKQDYLAGNCVPNRPNSTDTLTAHAKDKTKPNDHKYTLLVYPSAGGSKCIDPHVIVVATGLPEA